MLGFKMSGQLLLTARVGIILTLRPALAILEFTGQTGGACALRIDVEAVIRFHYGVNWSRVDHENKCRVLRTIGNKHAEV